MATTLLGSPGEVRNLITEYVLSDERGLVYREIYDGEPKRTRYFFTIHKQDQVNQVIDHSQENDADDTSAREFNQLKYVCQQLREETIDLELKFNRLYFHGSRAPLRLRKGCQYRPTRLTLRILRPGPSDFFLGFLSKPSRKPRLDFLRRITLMGKKFLDDSDLYGVPGAPPDKFQSLVRVAEICKSNPKVDITYLLPFISDWNGWRRWHGCEKTLGSNLIGVLLNTGISYKYLLLNRKVPECELSLYTASHSHLSRLARRLIPRFHQLGDETATTEYERTGLRGEDWCGHQYEDGQGCGRLMAPNFKFRIGEADEIAELLQRAKRVCNSLEWPHLPERLWEDRFEVIEGWLKNGF